MYDDNVMSYVCPNCGEVQTEWIEWQNASLGYRKSVSTNDYIVEDPEIVAGEIEGTSCPNCKVDIDIDSLIIRN